ncbi:MAG TPA: hypothetical protein VL856_05460 [Acidimicrobiia bacterium]|nr:hypothetical protein [Acidimicrobiia bacterium]
MNTTPLKSCPSCSERVRATAKKCQFCSHNFTALPRGSRAPLALIVVGLLLAMGGVVSPMIAIAAAITIVIGTALALTQRPAHVIAPMSISMSMPVPAAAFTTARGYARHA